MRYEIRITERIGPLLAAALEGIQVTHLPPRAVITGVRGDPSAAPRLMRRLQALGLTVDEVRIRPVPSPAALEQTRAAGR
jgi:hypothetical protein